MLRAVVAMTAFAALSVECKFLSIRPPVMPAKPAEELREKHYPPAHLFAKSSIPAHAKFAQAADGVFELEANPALRINLGGKGQKRWAEIATGKAANHEKFTFKYGAIRLNVNPNICLGAEGGVLEDGARVRAQACESGAYHQAFFLTREGRIRAARKTFCMTVRDSLRLGEEIVLGHCSGEAGFFVHRNGMIQAKGRTDLHFNIQGGAADAPIVLWKSEPSNNEVFEFSDSSRLRMKSRPSMCLVAQQGVSQGSQIIGLPCSTTVEPLPNEMFGYDKSRSVIYAVTNPNLVFNAKGGGMRHGDEIVLWSARPQDRRGSQTASGGDQEL